MKTSKQAHVRKFQLLLSSCFGVGLYEIMNPFIYLSHFINIALSLIMSDSNMSISKVPGALNIATKLLLWAKKTIFNLREQERSVRM